jgi:hypothetical protein
VDVPWRDIAIDFGVADVLHLYLPCLKNSCHRPLGWIHDWDWKRGPRCKWSAFYVQVVVTISIHQILWYVSIQPLYCPLSGVVNTFHAILPH